MSAPRRTVYNKHMTPRAQTTESPAHRRLHERLVEYWEAARKGHAVPDEGDIDPEELHDIWDSCFLVKIDEAAKKGIYRYNYLGLSLIAAYGDDLTGRDICETLVQPASPLLVKKIGEVVKTAAPTQAEGEFTNRSGMVIRYRAMLVPLGKSKNEITYVLGGMRWRPY